MNFLRCRCINFSVICSVFWAYWSAEAKTRITQPVGSKVTLNCCNTSIDTTSLAVWKMNGKQLFSLRNKGKNIITYNESVHLNLKISESEIQLYALIIENAQKSHQGNYTCETSTDQGLLEENWELIITEGDKGTGLMNIAVIAAVPSACFLIIISVLVILTIRKHRSINRSPAEIRQQKQTEEIYENHLEIQRRHARHKP